ncbi:NHL domain-containing thioredoxin family protein [Spelaeicoccus albus]|nr:NHL domain-containing thioredoxin family protein [Spelaeicoccus albus]
MRAPELTGRRWLGTGGRDITLADLRGKVVLLDFWTFCCINCLHVLDELRPLEEKYSDVLVIIGVHSPKFEFERTPEAVEAAVERYEVEHPVLDDPNLTTWQAYTARAWPTLAVIDPEGYVAANLSGEGHGAGLAVLIEELIAEHDAKGTLHRGDGPYVPPAEPESELKFPGKALALPGGGYLVSDSGHHRLVEFAPDGETIRRVIGTGERGLVDGGPDLAQLSEPQGLALLPDGVRAAAGYDVVVADTVNHALRGLRLDDGSLTTVAGTGDQYKIGAADNRTFGQGVDPGWYDGPADAVKLSSPWDVEWSDALGAVLVAMAGNHTLWTFDPAAARIAHFAGTMNEGLEDGAPDDAWFAQTSGITIDSQGRAWFVDSETSSLRYLQSGPAAGTSDTAFEISTAVGEGLFDFGFRDGLAAEARFQHPLGITVLPDESIAVADTYNGAVRRYDPETAEVSTLAQGLAEPSDLLVVPAESAEEPVHLLVVESAAHRLTRVAIPAHAQQVSGPAQTTSRPPTEIAAGTLHLAIGFEAPTGQKLDDRWGDPTWLQISSTPAELLVGGSGAAEGLARTLTIAPDVPDGVLHISARAAACDGDPVTGELPDHAACHLYQQDWGIPVHVDGAGADSLTLDLRGV